MTALSANAIGAKVFLIGAGPGDPGLLTLKARDILASADVVVYDALAASALLAYAQPNAELIYVGKVADNHALPQDAINALLVRTARANKIVARLKGGDPYIFGRGGEEALALLEAGIAFEEVPGVSSAIAAPAYAGIPLTHRGMASSVTIITGHESADKPASVHNWKALAASASTLVFVMGMKNLPDIAANLLEAGLAPTTPAAVIYRGTSTAQRSLLSTLARLPEEAAEFSNPSVIVVGQVAALRDRLNWFEQQPLFGKSVVVTRAREQASGLASLLTALGAEVLEFPTIEIRPLPEYSKLDAAIARLSGYTWVIFTSVNGVRHFWRRLHYLHKDSRALAACGIAAIGPATAQALAEHGIRPDFVPTRYVAEGITDGLLSEHGKTLSGAYILLPRAAVARDALQKTLTAAGAVINVVPCYETALAVARKEEVLQRLEAGTLSCVTFGSSSTVENFLTQIPPKLLKQYPQTRLAAIGPITAQTLRSYGLDCHIQPKEYTIPALVDALRNELP